jgi:hypothetical protein
MPFISGAAAVLALQLGMPAVHNETPTPDLVQVRGGWCGNGYDIDIYGRCYPNGVIPPQYQSARQGYYRGGSYYGDDYYRPRRRYHYHGGW